MPPSTSVHVFLKSITIFLLQQSALPFVLQKQPVHEINPNKQQWRKAISAQEQHRLRASSTCTSDDDTDSYSSSIFAPISSILHNNNNDKVTDPKILQRIVNFGTSYDSHTARLEGRWLRTFEDVQTKQGVLSYLQTVHGSWTLQDAELFYRRSRNEELVIDRVYNGDSGEVVLGEFQFSDDDDDDDDDDENGKDDADSADGDDASEGDMCDVGLHYDADYGLEAQSGGQIVLHPHVATVTYFSNYGVPTCIFNVKGSDILNMDPISGGSIAIDTMYASAPKIGKHIAFDGELIHGAPSEVFASPLKYDTFDRSFFCHKQQSDSSETAKRQKVEQVSRRRLRMTFLANVWLNHRPLDAEELDDNLLKQMKLTAQDIKENSRSSQKEDNIAMWNGFSAGIHVSREKPSIRGVLVDTKSGVKFSNSKLVEAEIGGRTCSIEFHRLMPQSLSLKPGESLNIAWENTCLVNIGKLEDDEE